MIRIGIKKLFDIGILITLLQTFWHLEYNLFQTVINAVKNCILTFFNIKIFTLILKQRLSIIDAEFWSTSLSGTHETINYHVLCFIFIYILYFILLNFKKSNYSTNMICKLKSRRVYMKRNYLIIFYKIVARVSIFQWLI